MLFRIKTKQTTFEGLEGYPDIVPKTMTPDTSPEKAATSAVVFNGGYDPCEFGVITSLYEIQAEIVRS